MGIASNRCLTEGSFEAARASRRSEVGIGVAVAEAGIAVNMKTMDNKNQFSLANRKQLADVLGTKEGGLRSRAKGRFHERRRSLYESFLNEHAERKGAGRLLKEIQAAKERIEEWEAELSTLGFDLDYSGELELQSGSRNPIDKLIYDRIEKEIGVSEDIDARFDSAQIAMMTIASLEDAEKLLKSVSEI
jgi:hypothetical protein